MASCESGKQATPAIDRTNFDESVALNEDFYQYATGGWQAKNPLKPEFARYGVFDVMRENNEIRINELFNAMTQTTAEKGSVEQKISDLYKMGLDSVRLNAEGMAPVMPDVDKIMTMQSIADLPEVLAYMHTVAGSPLFNMGVGADLLNSNINTLYVEQGGLGMGNRDNSNRVFNTST